MTDKTTEIEKAADDSLSRFKMSESGYIGLNIFNGISNDELKKELNFPNNIKVFKEMSYHSTINSALSLYLNLCTKADWVVKEVPSASPEEKKQAEFLRECMQDMEHSWEDFIKDALTKNIFGFSVHEKVYRKRFSANGSKYNDGKIGWKKLPIRSQESIQKFIFSEDGNEVIGVKQNIANLSDPYNRFANRNRKEVQLPLSKVLLFRSGNHRGDPFGKSLLRDSYLSWRYLTTLEETEANGVAKDLAGLPILMLPPQYLSKDATPDQVAIRKYYERSLANLQVNQQSAMMLPQAFDPETKQPLFKLELLSLEGKKGFDTTKIKEYYKNAILTSLFADILIMGQSATGSFALGQIKNSLSGTMAETILREIKDVINRDLIRQTYELNGWNTSRMATLDFENVDSIDAETFSKFIQRTSSVGMLTKDLDTVNRIRETLGLDSLPEGTDFESLLPESTSKASKGMDTPFEGTRTSQGSGDDNSSNMDNTA